MEQEELYDLLIVADATYSMSDYLSSLQTSLPQIISISALTGCFSRIGLLGYRDYSDDNVLEWSGWLSQSPAEAEGEQPDLVAKAKSILAQGGGDYPEATKTGLAKAYEVMRAEATTIILLYTDAPPHATVNRSAYVTPSNYAQEKKALSDPKSYGGFGPSFVDWVSACRMLRNGEKKAQVFCILEPSMAWQYVGHYNYLSTITVGSCIYLRDKKPSSISKVTVEILLAWMGVEKADISDVADMTEFPADLSRYVNIENIKKVKDENDKLANCFFATTSSIENKTQSAMSTNVTSTRMTLSILKKYLPHKKTPVCDFARSWKTSTAYRTMAISHLRNIITNDVRAISLNPVFGSLWRAVCNDRDVPEREGLIASFGLQIERIANADEKAQMKAWLEDSYDYTAEVRDIITRVSDDERFPCVCVDPTLSFVLPSDADIDDENDDFNRPITAFKRDELLEIGRSCDFKILRRLGRILTRLTYIKNAAEMPEHIAVSSDEEVPKIPMALASEKYGRQFWRILLHIIVPGTMLSARPSALLAALSLRLGVEPLAQAAEREMLVWRDRWNDIEVPENWNVSCLSLLLDADRAYLQRQQGLTHGTANGHERKSNGLIKDSDKALFERLIAFRMLKLNLDSALMAQVGWTPEKTLIPIGPAVICKSCHFLRSVTVMGRGGKCGSCLYTDYISQAIREKYIQSRVSKDDTETTPAIWVECSVRTCRAQYIVYNVEALNVQPKCHYCRSQGALPIAKRSDNPAPWVECTICLNRVIWPEAYRPSSFSKSEYKCQPCTSGRKTIVETETTTRKLSAENTTAWIIHDSSAPAAAPKTIQDSFPNRSLYHTISTIGPTNFLSRINLFPSLSSSSPLNLTLRGKILHNTPPLLATLQSLISSRTTLCTPCSLCFNNFPPSSLQPACGRRGCSQSLCRTCLSQWYGLNAPGRILNTAALACPFCRRAPAARTLAKYGLGIHAVGDLKVAAEERGAWIYAWCSGGCGMARRYMERVCAQGGEGAGELRGWECDICREGKELRRRIVELMRTEQAIADARMARDLRALEEAEARRERLMRMGIGIEIERSLKGAKPCPGCGVVTEKVGGCDHITCPTRGCGAHWCYFCGEAFSERGIYQHLNEAHNGFYGGFEEEGWDSE